jgi:circadian clock protein KaiC
MLSGMLSAGIDLRPALRAQTFLIKTALPEAMGSDNHLMNALQTIDSFKPEHVTIDAISACIRMGSQHAAFDYLMRLVAILKERGITCILTNQTSLVRGSSDEASGLGLSSIVDTVIELRFVDAGQEIVRQIAVVKSRGSGHSNRREPFYITEAGIDFPNNLPPPSARAGHAFARGGAR